MKHDDSDDDKVIPRTAMPWLKTNIMKLLILKGSIS